MKLNPLAIAVSTVAQFIYGFLHYTLFVAPWAAALGKTPEQIASQTSPFAFVLAIVTPLLVSLGIGWLLESTNSHGLSGGLKMGALACGLFILGPILQHALFALVPPTVAIIDAANSLVATLLGGGILGVLKKSGV